MKVPRPEAPEPRRRPAARHELYVYYRAAEADATALQDAVSAMHSALCAAHPGLQARLLRRPLGEAGQHTWMEAYVLPDGAEPEALAASIEQAARALQRWTSGPRHVERFIACAS